MITGHEANIVACMEPAEQAKRLAKERAAIARTELDEQKKFYGILRKHRKERRLWFHWSRSDKRTTCPVGQWDFTIWLSNGRELRMEFKGPKGKLSPEQADVCELMRSLHHAVLIIRSSDEAQRLVELYLNMNL